MVIIQNCYEYPRVCLTLINNDIMIRRKTSLNEGFEVYHLVSSLYYLVQTRPRMYYIVLVQANLSTN